MRESLLHPHRKSHALRLTAAIVVLLVSALPIERNHVPSLERGIFHVINDLPDAFYGLFLVVMQLGNLAAAPVAALLALFLTRRFRVPLDLLLSGTIAWVLARVVKDALQRGRPLELIEEVIVRGPAAEGYGYVSGHAAVATAMAVVAVTYLGRRGRIVVLVLAALVCIGRVYVGVHLPLDVVGGAAMGWAIGSLIHFLVLPQVTGQETEDGQAVEV